MTKPLYYMGQEVSGDEFDGIMIGFGYTIYSYAAESERIFGILASMAERIENLEREVEKLSGSSG